MNMDALSNILYCYQQVTRLEFVVSTGSSLVTVLNVILNSMFGISNGNGENTEKQTFQPYC